MASIRDIKTDETLVCYDKSSPLHKLRRYGFHQEFIIYIGRAPYIYYELLLSHIEILGAHFTSIFSIISIMAGWIAEMLFMLLFAYIAV